MILYTKTIEKIYRCLCNKQIVYIFCSGIQRSSAIIACFLMKYMHINPVYAVQYLCNKIKMSEHDYIFRDTIQYYYHYLHHQSVENQKIDENKKKERLGPRIQPI